MWYAHQKEILKIMTNCIKTYLPKSSPVVSNKSSGIPVLSRNVHLNFIKYISTYSVTYVRMIKETNIMHNYQKSELHLSPNMEHLPLNLEPQIAVKFPLVQCHLHKNIKGKLKVSPLQKSNTVLFKTSYHF